MAKFNIEIELAWIDEDDNLDNAVSRKLLSRLEEKISSSVIDKLEKNVFKHTKEAAENAVRDAINKAVSKRIEIALSTKKTITDEYGNVKDNDFTLEKLVQKSVSQAMTKKTIDKDGRYSNGGYGSNSPKYSLLEYLVMEQAKCSLEEQTKSAVALVQSELKNTEEKIHQTIKDNIQTNVADKLTSLIMDNSAALGLKQDKKQSSWANQNLQKTTTTTMNKVVENQLINRGTYEH